MKTSVIIPVKSFSKSKSRLNLPATKKEDLCEIMLKEILEVISNAKTINDIIIVSKDESAFSIGRKFNCIEIIDESESGVNNAVSLANEYLVKNDYSCSVVLPQDIPLILTEDLDNLLNHYQNRKNAIIVPSRHFDGTNALVRSTKYQMETRYDEGSYMFQFEPMKKHKIRYSLALIHRIMTDIDSIYDVNYALKQKIKTAFSEEMKKVIFS